MTKSHKISQDLVINVVNVIFCNVSLCTSLMTYFMPLRGYLMVLKTLIK